MYKRILFLSFLFLPSTIFSQQPRDKIALVIDSVLLRKDPEPGNDLKVTDVADLRVIKNKDSLILLGFEGYDGVTYIFTKAYRSRPDSLRRIPSSGQMEQKESVWFFRDALYSGQVIDYYYSGKKKGDGLFVNGKPSGLRRIYFKSGLVRIEKNYRDGLATGLSREFYPDGSLRQKGIYLNGKQEGIWEDYFPNGQIELRGNYQHGDAIDSVYRYYSSGRIKEVVVIKNGKIKFDSAQAKIAALLKKSKEYSANELFDEAIESYNKIIQLDSGFAGAYFSKATLELHNEKFDQSISDFDLALHFEPYFMSAYTNRAFARIRKQESLNSRPLLKNSDITVRATRDKIDISAVEKEKICTDLNQAIFLGESSATVYEALAKYCE